MADRIIERTLVSQIAQKLWSEFDKNERTGVRFGMFPASKMQAAEADNAAKGEDAIHPREFGRMLAVELMRCASSDGGMRA